MLLALLPTLLVMAQPDLGTSIVYVTIALALLFVAGTKWTHFAALGGLAAAAVALVLVIAPAAGVPLLKGYQKDRLTAFLQKDNADPAEPGLPAQPGRDRDRVRPQDRPRHRARDPDAPRLPPREPHGLRVRGGRRAVRVRRGRHRAVPLCPVDLAIASDPHDRQEPLRGAARRRSRRDADDAGVRERRR